MGIKQAPARLRVAVQPAVELGVWMDMQGEMFMQRDQLLWVGVWYDPSVYQ